MTPTDNYSIDLLLDETPARCIGTCIVCVPECPVHKLLPNQADEEDEE